MEVKYYEKVEKTYNICDICGKRIDGNHDVSIYNEQARKDIKEKSYYKFTFTFHENCLVDWWEKK